MSSERARPKHGAEKHSLSRVSTAELAMSDGDYPLDRTAKTKSWGRSEKDAAAEKSKKKTKWLQQAKDWLGTSEPSAQVWKQHRKEVFAKHGIDATDPCPNAKVGATFGTIPQEAVKPSSGPTPEQRSKQRGEERRRRSRQAFAEGTTPSSWSVMSGSGSSSTGRDPSVVAPWES